MGGRALLVTHRPAAWHAATVRSVSRETASARRIAFEVPTWPGNDAGAHLDVRLTAPDGYQASRSYSIASSGDSTRVVLAVDEVPNGEVSPFLVHELQPGDQVALFTARRVGDAGSRGDSVGTYVCADLSCHENVRLAAPLAPNEVRASVDRRIDGTRHRVESFVERVTTSV